MFKKADLGIELNINTEMMDLFNRLTSQDGDLFKKIFSLCQFGFIHTYLPPNVSLKEGYYLYNPEIIRNIIQEIISKHFFSLIDQFTIKENDTYVIKDENDLVNGVILLIYKYLEELYKDPNLKVKRFINVLNSEDYINENKKTKKIYKVNIKGMPTLSQDSIKAVEIINQLYKIKDFSELADFYMRNDEEGKFLINRILNNPRSRAFTQHTHKYMHIIQILQAELGISNSSKLGDIFSKAIIDFGLKVLRDPKIKKETFWKVVQINPEIRAMIVKNINKNLNDFKDELFSSSTFWIETRAKNIHGKSTTIESPEGEIKTMDIPYVQEFNIVSENVEIVANILWKELYSFLKKKLETEIKNFIKELTSANSDFYKNLQANIQALVRQSLTDESYKQKIQSLLSTINIDIGKFSQLTREEKKKVLIKSILLSIGEKIIEYLKNINTKFIQIIDSIPTEAEQNVFNNIFDKFTDIILPLFEDTLKSIDTRILKSLIDNLLENMRDKVFQDIKTKIIEIISKKFTFSSENFEKELNLLLEALQYLGFNPKLFESDIKNVLNNLQKNK